MYYMHVKFISKSELAVNEFELLSVSVWVLWQTVRLSRVSPVPRRMTVEIVTCSTVTLNIINIGHAEEFGRMNPKLRMKYFIILGVVLSLRKSPWYAMSSEQYYANAFSYPPCLYVLQRNWKWTCRNLLLQAYMQIQYIRQKQSFTILTSLKASIVNTTLILHSLNALRLLDS